jgi:hypothetical protein
MKGKYVSPPRSGTSSMRLWKMPRSPPASSVPMVSPLWSTSPPSPDSPAASRWIGPPTSPGNTPWKSPRNVPVRSWAATWQDCRALRLHGKNAFHTQQNRTLLEQLSAATGGRYWRPQDLSSLPRDISYSEAGISLRDTKPLWNMPALFLLLLSMICGQWLLRRKWGVV